MKLPGINRILPLLLVVLLLPALLAVPARADEVTESGWINLMDYGCLDDGASHSKVFSNGDSFFYLVPDYYLVRRIELVFTSSQPIDKLGFTYNYRTDNLQYAEVVYFGDGLYKATLDTYYGAYSIGVVPTFSNSSLSIFNVLSFEVSSISSIYRQLPAHMTGYVWDGSEFSLDYNGDLVYTSWSGGNATADYRRFSTYLYVNGNVDAYDYVDVDLTLSVSGIQSIAVDDGFDPLPYEINSIYQPSDTVGTLPNVLVSLRIDVRGLEGNAKPYIRITGDSSTGGNIYQINYVGGILVVDPPSTLTYWFTQLDLWISEQTSTLSAGFSNIVNSIGSGFSNVSTWITNQTNSIGTFFTTLGNNISSGFSNVGTWITNQTDSVGSFFIALGNDISSFFTSQTNSIGTWFSDQMTILSDFSRVVGIYLETMRWENLEGFNGVISAVQTWGNNIVTSVTTWGQNIVDALTPEVDTSQMENDVADAKDNLDDAQQAMENFTLPQADSVVPDVSGELELGTGSHFATIMEGFFSDPLILQMVTTGVAFMLFGVIMG